MRANERLHPIDDGVVAELTRSARVRVDRGDRPGATPFSGAPVVEPGVPGKVDPLAIAIEVFRIELMRVDLMVVAEELVEALLLGRPGQTDFRQPPLAIPAGRVAGSLQD